MEMVSRLDVAANWPENDRQQLFLNREKLLLAFDRETAALPHQLIQSDPHLMLAAISLAQEGHLRLDSNNESLLHLTNTGQRFAAGARALSHG